MDAEVVGHYAAEMEVVSPKRKRRPVQKVKQPRFIWFIVNPPVPGNSTREEAHVVRDRFCRDLEDCAGKGVIVGIYPEPTGMALIIVDTKK